MVRISVLFATVFSVTPKETTIKSCLVYSMCIVSLGLIADEGISVWVNMGIIIRSARITGIAMMTKIMGFATTSKGHFCN